MERKKATNNSKTNKKKFKCFTKDENGAVTIEFVMWVPVFVLIMAITVDASILLTSQANMWNIARDTARGMAVGLHNDTDAETYAFSKLPSSWRTNTTIDASRNANFASVNLSIPMKNITPFNIVSAFSNGNITVELIQRIEPR